MILLSGHSLTPARKVPMEALGVTLTERDSTAQMTPADMTGIGVNSWLKDDDGNVWRVVSISQNYLTDTPTVQLEHVVHALQDRILFGEITAADIAGGGATTCTAKQAVQYILGQQSDFVLGTFDYNSVSNPYKFDGDSLYDALEYVSNSLDGCMWTYDLSVYPFRLNIIQKPNTVACELRPGRNLQTLSRTIDRSQMYTRFYPIGKDDLHISGNYVSRNENLYGIVSKVETDTSLETAAELTAWANERLGKHAEPTVTITADALELAAATGESLDRLKLGWKCRIPLTEFGTTITETITRIQYRDKVHSPEAAQVTLANNRTDVTRILADAMKNTAKGGRGGARQEKEDHAWIEDTDTRVAMVVGTNSGGNYIKAGEIALAINMTTGQSTATINADHVNISSTGTAHLLSGSIKYDADGNLVLVESSGAGIVVERTEGSTTAQYGVFDNGTLTSGVIATKVNGYNSTNIIADKIMMSSASGANSVQVEVNGKITANDITAQFIQAKLLDASSIDVYGLNVIGNCYVMNGGGNMQNVSAAIWDLDISLDSSTGIYTLKRKRISDGSWVDVGTFSRATTLSGAWSGATFTVTASPQGNTKATTITLDGGTGGVSSPDYTANSFISHKAYVNVKGSQTSGTATVKKILVDATSEYDSGADSVTAATPERQSGNTFSANKKTVYFNVRSKTSTGKVSGWTQVSADVSESYNAGYDAGYNAGWNACRTASQGTNVPNGVYTGVWAGTLYTTNSQYAQARYNCVYNTTYYDVDYLWTDPGTK